MTCYEFECSHWLKLQHSDWRANLVKDFFKQIFYQWEHSNNNTGHVIYKPAYTYKFQLKTTQVICCWIDVQRTWSHLESIFIGSEDIRKQLPVDSERFDDIDAEFKKLMAMMAKTPNVVKATNVPGKYSISSNDFLNWILFSSVEYFSHQQFY